MKNLLSAAIALTVMVLAAPGNAADMYGSIKDTPAGTTVVETSSNPFAGAYIGVFGAWERMDVEHGGTLTGETLPGTEPITGELPGIDDDAFVFGANAGYNFTAGRVYFGPRVSFSYGETEATLLGTDVDADLEGFDASLTVSKEWLFELDAKLGVALTDRIGVYVVGGVAIADLEARATVGTIAEIAPGGLTVSHGDTLTGWSAGIGTDVVLFGNLHAFAEYKHFDLGSLDASGNVSGVAYDYSADTRFDVVKVGLNLSF